MAEFGVKFVKNEKELDTLIIDADNIEVKFVKNEKEIDTFVIDAENIEEAKTIAEDLAHADGVWSNDLEINVAKEF